MRLKVIITNNIEELIDAKHKETGMTKTWMAQQMGISRQGLNILTKTNNPTIESLIKVSYVLKCRIDDLISYDISIEE